MTSTSPSGAKDRRPAMPAAPATAGSKPDLMFHDEIRGMVREAYETVEDPRGAGAVLYDADDLQWLPEGARRWALGVGAPVAHARLESGEHVIDLGCGTGIDALLAARAVAPHGRVVGVDMLASMIDRARRFADRSPADGVAFVQAPMEQLPFVDGCADVVLSNGAINLTARKSRVLAEAFRVLRPGGRMVVADLTIDEEDLPSEILTHPSAWAG